jgi:hypothetical protein
MDCDEDGCHRTVCGQCVNIPEYLRHQPNVKFTCPACHIQRELKLDKKTPYKVIQMAFSTDSFLTLLTTRDFESDPQMGLSQMISI